MGKTIAMMLACVVLAACGDEAPLPTADGGSDAGLPYCLTPTSLCFLNSIGDVDCGPCVPSFLVCRTDDAGAGACVVP